MPETQTWAECPQCRHRFPKARPHQVYCTDRCRKIAWDLSQALKTSTCPQCGKKFQKVRPHHTYCTNTCKIAAWWQRKIDEAIIRQAPAGLAKTKSKEIKRG